MKMRLALVLVAAGLAPAPVCAQTVLLELHGDSTHYAFGYDLDGAGDVDADGVDDVIISNTRLRREVRVFSGVDGRVLHVFRPTPLDINFGHRVAGVGDVDGDGHGDIAYSAPGGQRGSVYVRSGRSGEVLHLLQGSPGEFFGVSLDGGGDVDADGRPDIAVGVWGSIAPGQPDFVRLWSGRTGELIREIDEPLGGMEFARTLSNAGDLDHDGYPDLVVGDPEYGGYGAAWVFSGLDGAVLHALYGDPAHDRFAWDVSGLGDVNDDGTGDILLGQPRLLPAGAGEVHVYSGADGELLYRILGESPGDILGQEVEGLGDVDGDGKPDFACSARLGSSVRFFSGVDGAPINTFPGLEPGDGFGKCLAAAGDLDGDDVPDVIAGTGNQYYGEGYALVLSCACMQPPERYCEAAPNSSSPRGARIGSIGFLSVLDERFVLTVEDAPPAVPGLFVYGLSPGHWPFGEGYLCIDPFGGRLHRLPAMVTTPTGSVASSLSFSSLPGEGAITAGSTWCFQFLYRDTRGGPAGFNGSDALRATFCP